MGDSHHWQTISNTLDDLIIVADQQTWQIRYTNQAAQHVLGYTPATFAQLTLPDLHPAGDVQTLHETLKRTTEGAVPSRHEILLTHDGTPVAVETRYTVSANSLLLVGVSRIVRQTPTALEDELARLSSLSQTIIDAAPIGIFVFDREGRVTIINRRHLEINQIDASQPLQQFLGMPILEKNATVAKNKLLAPLKEVLKGIPFDIERENFVTRHNQTISVRIQGVPLCGASDDIIGGLVLVEDITDQLNARKQVEQSEHHYRSLVKALPDLFFRIDADGRFLDYESAEIGLYTEPENFLDHTIDAVMPSDVATLMHQTIKQALQTNTLQSVEYRLYKDNVTRWYEARVIPTKRNEVLAVIRDVTEAKKARQALAESERRFRSLAEAMPDLIFHLDQEGRYLDFRVPPGRGYFEPKPEDILGKKIADVIPPEASKSAMPYFYEAVRTGKLTVAEYTIKEPGGFKHYECRFSPTTDNSEIIAVVRNITERKTQEKLLASIAQATNHLLTARDLDPTTISHALGMLGHALYADFVHIMEIMPSAESDSPPVITLRGMWVAPDQQAQFNSSDLQNFPWPVEINEWYARLIQGEIVNGLINTFPQPLQTAFEKMRIKSLLIVPIFADDAFWGIITFSDCTVLREWTQNDIQALRTMAASIGGVIQRNRIEENLIRERQNADTLREVGTVIMSTLELPKIFELLLDQLRKVIDYDAANVMILEDNRARIVFYTGYEKFDTDPQDIDNLTFVAEDTPLMQRIIATNQPVICPDVLAEPGWLVRPSTQWIRSWIGVPIISREKKVIGLFSLDSANTGRYDPAKHTTVVEAVAQQAAIAIENAQLFNNINDLEHVKSRMIDMASHDLRTPLNNVQNALRALETSDHNGLSPSKNARINDIWQATNRMDNIIRKLLSLKRIEERHQKAEKIVWATVIEDSVAMQTASLAAKQQTLTINYQPDLPATYGDPVQLTHALANLIQNASKYTPDGGKIEVRGYIKDYGGKPCVAIEVEDTGAGIPRELQAELFKPFYRAQHENSDDIPGTGLGLSMVKATIEEHNGRVYFDSIPGQGSMFGFWVPV